MTLYEAWTAGHWWVLYKGRLCRLIPGHHTATLFTRGDLDRRLSWFVVTWDAPVFPPRPGWRGWRINPK